MSAGPALLDNAEIANAHVPVVSLEKETEKELAGSSTKEGQRSYSVTENGSVVDTDISEEDLQTLRRVSGHIPWQAFTITFVELCERFSYYGTTAVFVNFIQRPLPPGYPTGANPHGIPGALGMGQRASTGLTTFNSFWSYVMPLFGAWIADEFLGRFKTIQVSIAFALVGHLLFIICSLPPVIASPNGSIACFSIGVIIMGIGTGGFKSNISPLMAEQLKDHRMVIETTAKGERVIKDPAVTVSRVFLYFYMMINVGSLIGSIGMVYAEKYVGFWLSFTLPTIMFCIAPLVLYFCKNKYTHTVPTGSVAGKALRLWSLAMKPCWHWNPVTTIARARRDGFWERVKPSKIEVKPAWMTFDDEWVDEVRRGVKACTVFLWLPIYFLTYNQMTNNLTSQAATMELHGVPNDVINNLNPLSLVIFIPIMDKIINPALRKRHIKFTPIKRIFLGFMFGVMAMIVATVTQVYIYRMSPCGDHPNSCDDPAPINVWVQTLSYVFIGFSEIFANITSLEYAFTKAPKNMRSLVMGINLLMNAFSSALGQALVPLSDDPLLVWNYGSVAVVAFIAGCLFWIAHRKLDVEEDHLNMLKDSTYTGRKKGHVEETAAAETVETKH